MWILHYLRHSKNCPNYWCHRKCILGGYVSCLVTFCGPSVNPKCNNFSIIQFQMLFFSNFIFHGSKKLEKHFGLHESCFWKYIFRWLHFPPSYISGPVKQFDPIFSHWLIGYFYFSWLKKETIWACMNLASENIDF